MTKESQSQPSMPQETRVPGKSEDGLLLGGLLLPLPAPETRVKSSFKEKTAAGQLVKEAKCVWSVRDG